MGIEINMDHYLTPEQQRQASHNAPDPNARELRYREHDQAADVGHSLASGTGRGAINAWPFMLGDLPGIGADKVADLLLKIDPNMKFAHNIKENVPRWQSGEIGPGFTTSTVDPYLEKHGLYPTYQPETKSGEIADKVGGFIGGNLATTPLSLAGDVMKAKDALDLAKLFAATGGRAVTQGVGSGVGSEAAHDTSKAVFGDISPGAQTAIDFTGAVVGGGAGGYAANKSGMSPRTPATEDWSRIPGGRPTLRADLGERDGLTLGERVTSHLPFVKRIQAGGAADNNQAITKFLEDTTTQKIADAKANPPAQPQPQSASQQAISDRAHQMWEEAGKPEGRDSEFWGRAEEQVTAENKAVQPTNDKLDELQSMHDYSIDPATGKFDLDRFLAWNKRNPEASIQTDPDLSLGARQATRTQTGRDLLSGDTKPITRGQMLGGLTLGGMGGGFATTLAERAMEGHPIDLSPTAIKAGLTTAAAGAAPTAIATARRAAGIAPRDPYRVPLPGQTTTWGTVGEGLQEYYNPPPPPPIWLDKPKEDDDKKTSQWLGNTDRETATNYVAQKVGPEIAAQLAATPQHMWGAALANLYADPQHRAALNAPEPEPAPAPDYSSTG